MQRKENNMPAVSILLEKKLVQFTVITTSIMAACLSLLIAIYLWGFETNADSLFKRLIPFLVSIMLMSSVCVIIILRRWGSVNKIIVPLGIIFMGHLIYFWLFHSFFDFVIDDAFITFRYSRNLADGFGPTFNTSGAPVEGYTTFLWMLIMSIPHLISFDALLFSKLVGIGLGEMTMIVAMLISAEITESDSPDKRFMAAALTSIFVAAFFPVAIHSVSGMETILFAALLASTVYLVIVFDSNKSTLVFLSVSMLLLGLTRPEGNLLNAGLLFIIFLTRSRTQKKMILCSTVLLYFLPGIVYFAWRMAYYQLLFPLPYYSKLGNNHRPEGVADVTSFVLSILPSIMIFLLFAFRKDNRQAHIVATPILVLLLFYLFPQHIMGVYSRFVFPSAPLIYALAGAGAVNFLAVFQWLDSSDKSTRIRTLLMSTAIALIAFRPLANIQDIINESQRARNAINPYIYFGRLLRAFPSPRPMTLAIGDAGAIPYYSDWNTIDLVGLNDPNVLFKSSEEQYLEYVFNADPDLVILTFNDPDTPVRDMHISIELYEAALANEMERVGVLRVSSTYYLWVFVERESELEAYLKMAFK